MVVQEQICGGKAVAQTVSLRCHVYESTETQPCIFSLEPLLFSDTIMILAHRKLTVCATVFSRGFGHRAPQTDSLRYSS